MAFSIAGVKIFAKDTGRGHLGRLLVLSSKTHGMWCACAHHLPSGTSRGSTGPHGELCLFFIKKSPFALTEAAQFKPFVPVETLKACALIGLHPMADGESVSRGGPSLDLGDMWRHGCPTSPNWDSDGEKWSESEGLSSSDFREHNVESHARHVIGLNWSGEKVSLFLEALGTCEGGLELPRCPGYDVPGNA